MTATPDFELLDGLSATASRYEAFIIDIWGVLHDGVKPFPGTVGCLEELKAAGNHVCLLSNTPNHGTDIAGRLEKMGIAPDLYNGIVTAGDSANAHLHDFAGQRCWYAGNHYGAPLVQDVAVEIVDGPETAELMVNDLYGLDEAELRAVTPLLQQAADKNLPMICGNPDMVVNIGGTLNDCPGTYAKLYEEMGGTVIYHGKPHLPVYERAWSVLGRPDKTKILAVGDSFHTDIQGANAFGIDSAFHLVGIHWEEVALDHAPDEADFDKVMTMISRQDHRPTYALKAFRWG